jgi:trigger factor
MEENKIVLKIRNNDYELAYTEEKADKGETKFAFCINGDLYSALEVEAYVKSKGKFNVEGFRKGKAPMHTIKRLYGDYAFLEEMIDIAVDQAYRAVYQARFKDMNIAVQPDLDYGKCNNEQINFTFIVTEFPTLDNLNYKGLEYKEVLPQEVTEEQINAKVDAARDKAGYWEAVEGRPAQDGDTTNINYAGTIDGVAFEGGTAEDQELVLGSHHFIEGFEEQVVGMNVGEEKDINVTFPADYGAKELAGKPAVFHVKLNEIRTKVLPQADDEFAKDVSEFDTLDELKASYRKELEESEKKRAQNATETNLLDAVIDANPLDLNDKIIDAAVEDKVNEFVRMLAQNGMTLEDYGKYTGVTREQMEKDYRPGCEKTEKRSLILTQIVKAEEIKVTPEDFDAKIEENAKELNKTLDEYKAELKPEEVDYIYNSMLSDKLVDFLIANNTAVKE